MLRSGGVREVVPAAHPVAGHPHLDVPVALIAAASFVLVVGLGLAVTARPGGAGRPGDAVPASWAGDLGRGQRAVRWLVVAVLLLSVVAARVGSENELENIAPALLVGAGWPLVFLGTLLLGNLWRWTDPWDTLGRAAVPGDRSSPAHDVRPALVVALALLWYLAVHPRPLDPRSLGAAVAVCTVLHVAGCLVRGRRRWLSSAEPVGIVLTWVARARVRGADEAPPRTGSQTTPRGLHALMGVVAGGTLFAALRRTELWSDLAGTQHPQLTGTAGLLVLSGVGAALVVLQARLTDLLVEPSRRPAARRAVVLAVGPALVGIVVAVGLARNRLSTSLQLLPGLVGDPLGRGWDLLGAPTDGLDPAPLGAAGLLVAQLVLLVGAHLWGAVVAARLLGRQQRLPALLLLGQLVAGGVAAVSLH